MLYEAELTQYIDGLITNKGLPAGKSSKDKARKAISDMIKILEASGHSWPDETDYEEYRKGKNEKTAKDNEARIKNFFDWLKTQREIENMNEANMPIGENVQGANDELDTLPDFVPSQAGNDEPEKNCKGKPGRKPKDKNGEKVDKVATLYLTPTQTAKFRALCSIDGLNASEWLAKIINAEIERNEDLISDFFALEEKRKERRKNT